MDGLDMPTLTLTQRNALQDKIAGGDIAGFYNDLDTYGDSYGRLGEAVTNNNTWQGELANGFAKAGAADNSVDMSYGSPRGTPLTLS